MSDPTKYVPKEIDEFAQRPLQRHAAPVLHELLESAMTYGWATGSVGSSYSAEDDTYRYEASYEVVRKGKALTEREQVKKVRHEAFELLKLLETACQSLDAAERCSRSHATADDIRERLCKLGFWKPALDEHGQPDYRQDPVSTDPFA